ncbi:MAG TPA: 6-hydroxymethylpterin diphosphokinase MptE-like protein, partial [Terriglobia bacterium]|nr:6-hydroxymethylpterin diphosphokinase MptE-like protein [Terriglobia bacterium]
MVTERLRRFSTKSGQTTVEIDGVAYHSPYNPLREARQFYSGLQLEEADILLHFGWGLGYCGEILRERTKKGARIIVFEPHEELFKLSLAEPANRPVFEDPRFRFVIGPEVRQFFDDWGLGECQETDQFLWVDWPAALRGHGLLAESLKDQFNRHLRDRAANLLTHFQRGETYFRNAVGNFEYQRDADAGGLFGRFTDIPLVIVSAGPSLDRNICDLRGFEDRCLILSVDTALRPLLAAGITPHAVIIADASELNARHVVGAMPDSACLIAEEAIHQSALQAATRRFLFGLGLFPDPLFAKF